MFVNYYKYFHPCGLYLILHLWLQLYYVDYSLHCVCL